MLKIHNLVVNYGAINALRGISLDVREGEVVTIIGGNGAGKSTLMKAVSGLEPVAGGSITFAGNDLTRMPAHRRVALGIAQSPEGRQVFPDQSVRDNLMLGAYLRDDKDSIAQDIEAQFALFPRLRERQSQMAGTMSGGEQQMLAISRALMARPSLLLLDEPSLGLAPLIIQQIFEIIKKINAESNTTVFLVEQNANQALKIAHRGYVMENGAITLEDRAENLLSNEDVKKAYLGM